MNNDPYATHLPILESIGILFRPKRILELGAGVYSTPTLCDTEIFPGVDYVHSYEESKEWVAHTRKRLKKKVPYLHFFSSDDPMPVQLETIDLESYDFLLIDNGDSLDKRKDTIKFIADRKLVNPLVVIHDFEHVAYQWAADPWEHLLVHVKQYPQTAVLWNGDRLTAQQSTMLQQAVLLERVY